MRYHGDKRAPKILIIAGVVLLGFLMFFEFDLQRAYDFAILGSLDLLRALYGGGNS